MAVAGQIRLDVVTGERIRAWCHVRRSSPTEKLPAAPGCRRHVNTDPGAAGRPLTLNVHRRPRAPQLPLMFPSSRDSPSENGLPENVRCHGYGVGVIDTGSVPETSDGGLALRVKALACTAPLHDLDARKNSVQTADYSVYQMAELALTAIDLVTIAMDFDRGARPDQVLADLARAATAQAPDRPETEHTRVASWVLDNLLNVGSADRGFRAIYGIAGPAGYDRRSFDFKLLEETFGADGELYLRASNEAVNVLVGALDVDIESAQIAADLRLGILIKRGRLFDAQAAAQAARYQTIRYAEMLRQRLEATTRDVRNVDWVEEMPRFLDEALSHIEDRYRTEDAILINLTEARDTADTTERKQQAAQLVEVVRDCLRRHAQLQAALQTAGHRFRAGPVRAVARPCPVASYRDGVAPARGLFRLFCWCHGPICLARGRSV